MFVFFIIILFLFAVSSSSAPVVSYLLMASTAALCIWQLDALDRAPLSRRCSRDLAGRPGAHLSDWLRLQTPRCHSTPVFTVLTNTLLLHLPPPPPTPTHPPAAPSQRFFHSLELKCARVAWAPAQIVLDVGVCLEVYSSDKSEDEKAFFPIISSHTSTHTTSTPAVLKMRPLWLPCASWGTVFSQTL